MGYRPRRDEPGALHHVMNRGVARRTIFERKGDFRFFLSLVAHSVRRGWIEVHSYALLPNHFHLLVTSRGGELDRCMRWVLSQHARRFNRRIGRDGPLFRDRFVSRRVCGAHDVHNLVAYIDQNPVKHGLARRVGAFPFASAHHYLRRCGPPWLSRAMVEDDVLLTTGHQAYVPSSYMEVFGHEIDESVVWFIEKSPGRSQDCATTLATLLPGAPNAIWRWLRRAAENADGELPNLPLIAPQCILRSVACRRARQATLKLTRTKRRRCGWTLLTVGLLRSVSGLSLEETATRAGVSLQTAARHAREHVVLLGEDELYGREAATILHENLAGHRRRGPRIVTQR